MPSQNLVINYNNNSINIIITLFQKILFKKPLYLMK